MNNFTTGKRAAQPTAERASVASPCSPVGQRDGGLTFRDRATMLLAIGAICISCFSLGMVIGGWRIKQLQEPPEVHQEEQSKTTKF